MKQRPVANAAPNAIARGFIKNLCAMFCNLHIDTADCRLKNAALSQDQCVYMELVGLRSDLLQLFFDYSRRQVFLSQQFLENPGYIAFPAAYPPPFNCFRKSFMSISILLTPA